MFLQSYFQAGDFGGATRTASTPRSLTGPDRWGIHETGAFSLPHRSGLGQDQDIGVCPSHRPKNSKTRALALEEFPIRA